MSRIPPAISDSSNITKLGAFGNACKHFLPLINDMLLVLDFADGLLLIGKRTDLALFWTMRVSCETNGKMYLLAFFGSI